MQVTEVRTENASFNLIASDDMPEIFADGFSHMMMAANHTKITFHSVIDPAHPENQVETRKGVVRLTIPTAILLELCRNVLFNAQLQSEVLLESGKQIDDQVKKIMSGVKIETPGA